MINSTGSSARKTYDVFLCHNSEDKPEVLQIYEALKVCGLKPWIDQQDLRPGDRWRPAVESALAEAGTALVFVGKAGGRVQVRETDVCIDLESRGKLRIIPVILPGCVDDANIDLFLRNYSWVDFRKADPNPLGQLCEGVGNVARRDRVAPVSRPVVAIAPMTTSDARSRLIVYCQNAGLLVPRAGIYPAEADSAAKAFKADLDCCHVVVQFSDPSSAKSSDDAVMAIEGVLSAHRQQQRVMSWPQGTITQSQFQKDVVDRTCRVFDALRPDPAMSSDQDKLPPAEPEIDQKWVMVKYDRVDAEATREMLRSLKEANIRCTSSPNGSTTLAQRLRENPFDALILVLGACDDDWLERRIDELIEVELTLKDQAPLQAYYYAEGATAVPPDISPTTLEVAGPTAFDQLIQAIRGGGA